MSLKAKCQATHTNFRSNVAFKSKDRKTSAIYGSLIRLRPNPSEYLTQSSRRRKRSATKDGGEGTSTDGGEGASKGGEEGAGKGGEEGAGKGGEEGAGKGGEEGAGKGGGEGAIQDGEVGASSAPASTPISFTKVLKIGGTHAGGCCRLVLQRTFCEMHNLEKHVTMTDSRGHKVWHMRFQSSGLSSLSRRPSIYAISNGWREFSYDHSLKPNDKLQFTLLSNSHFVVEFATSDGSTRAMLPTRDGTDYPWKMNYARLDCLSHANDVDTPKFMQQAVKENVIRKKVEAPIVIRKKQKPQEMFCQCHTDKVGRRRNTMGDASKEYVLPELTHLECKNPDGSSYLQIVDSDSEITCVDED